MTALETQFWVNEAHLAALHRSGVTNYLANTKQKVAAPPRFGGSSTRVNHSAFHVNQGGAQP